MSQLLQEDIELFRPIFIENLKRFKDEQIIKILCGVRRCGKSTILESYKNELISLGVKRKMYHELMTLIENAEKNQKIYLLLDEVQEVENWEKCINSLFENQNVDIYVTGSNSKLLSSEISTYLTGRFVQIPIFTLSFAEFIEFKNHYCPKNPNNSLDFYFDLYLKTGGFPFLAKTNHSQEENYQIIEGIFSNLEMFNRVVRFILENLGKTFSAKTIFDFFKSQHRAISIETVYNYLAWLEEAFIIYRCNRYDIQGKNVLKTQEKYYLSDVGFKYSQFGYSPKAIAAVLENLVYLELRRRGYLVFIGKIADKEIDFVATKQDQKIYVQVCRTLPEDSDREVGNLKLIKDNYPKYVVTMDSSVCGTDEGIKIIHIKDFLLEKNW